MLMRERQKKNYGHKDQVGLGGHREEATTAIQRSSCDDVDVSILDFHSDDEHTSR